MEHSWRGYLVGSIFLLLGIALLKNIFNFTNMVGELIGVGGYLVGPGSIMPGTLFCLIGISILVKTFLR